MCMYVAALLHFRETRKETRTVLLITTCQEPDLENKKIRRWVHLRSEHIAFEITSHNFCLILILLILMPLTCKTSKLLYHGEVLLKKMTVTSSVLA